MVVVELAHTIEWVTGEFVEILVCNINTQAFVPFSFRVCLSFLGSSFPIESEGSHIEGFGDTDNCIESNIFYFDSLQSCDLNREISSCGYSV